MKVIITQNERLWLSEIGRMRNASKHPSRTRRKSSKFSDRQLDVMGLYGEFAAAKVLGVSIDETISPSGDDGIDMRHNGQSIAVKFNHRRGGFLMVESRSNDKFPSMINDLKTDVIISTHGECAPPRKCVCFDDGDVSVNVAGWLTSEEFKQKAVAKNLGLGVRYICYVNQLNPIETIMPHCEDVTQCFCLAEVWQDVGCDSRGWIKTCCSVCGSFKGYRPPPVEGTSQLTRLPRSLGYRRLSEERPTYTL